MRNQAVPPKEGRQEVHSASLCSALGPTSSQLSLYMVQSSCLGVEALRVNKIGTCAPQVHTLGLLWGHRKITWVFFKHSFRHIDSFALGGPRCWHFSRSP